MHAHRIEIFDGTDDYAVVHPIAHHLHLEFLPADERFFDQHFVDRREIKAASSDIIEFLAIVGDATASSSQGECRSNDKWKRADFGNDPVELRHRPCHTRAGHFQADA